MPSEAWAEWQRVPFGMLERIVEYRGYAHAKAVWDATDDQKRLQGGWFDMVREIEFDLAHEEMGLGG